MTEIHDLNDQDRQIIDEFRANLGKSGEPRTRPTSIPVEGGPIYVFAGNRGALTNPVVLQKSKLIKIRVRFVVEEAFLDKRCALLHRYDFRVCIILMSLFFCNTTI